MRIASSFRLLETYQYSFEALIYKAKLESENINVFIKDNNTIDTYPLYSNAIGGVKLFVKSTDFDKANKILAATSKYSLDNDNHLIICPRCGAEKIEMKTSIQNLNSLLIFILGILIIPFMFFIKHKYRCDNCKFEFKKT